MAAELIGLIASIGQVAATGLKLYEYGASVAEAEGRLKGLQMEIRSTCIVLERLGSQLKRKRVRWMLSENTIQATREIVTACEDRFKALQAYVDKVLRTGARAKWTFYFREAKFEQLRDDLDRMIVRLNAIGTIINVEIQGRR